jgi:SPP1 family predicted phage head-tail adaptor
VPGSPAGKRNRRVAILTATTSDDGRGGQAVTWTPVASAPTAWASIRALSGTEFLQAGALQNSMTHLVEMDSRLGVTIKHRLYWPLKSKTFEIVGTRDSETDYGIEFECNEADS